MRARGYQQLPSKESQEDPAKHGEVQAQIWNKLLWGSYSPLPLPPCVLQA